MRTWCLRLIDNRMRFVLILIAIACAPIYLLKGIFKGLKYMKDDIDTIRKEPAVKHRYYR